MKESKFEDKNLYNKNITLAITGASGVQYGLRLLECLLASNCKVSLLLSRAAEMVITTETELQFPMANIGMPFENFLQKQQRWFSECYLTKEQTKKKQLTLFDREDWFSPIASGSNRSDSMVICPASGGTLSSIASGASNNLIERGADVVLKERRQLIVVPRETPYSQIHLENMLKLTQMGAVVLPASPGFYNRPTCIEDLIDFVVARIMDQLNLSHTLTSRWGD